MTSLFLLYASEDAACAETLRTGLEIQGYRLWRELSSLQMSDILHPHTLENAILGSAVVLLVWSRNAAQSVEVALHLPFVLDLKKAVLPLLLDQTALPVPLSGFVPFVVPAPDTDIVPQLMQQSLLPPPDSLDPLITLTQLAASDLLSERKTAVRQASAMLQRDEQRAAVLALLSYLAQHDQMMGVREPAQEILHIDARKRQPSQIPALLASLSTNAGDMISIRCKKCGNVTHFNKHRICKETGRVLRGVGDELLLQCGSCGEMMAAHVDCQGYK